MLQSGGTDYQQGPISLVCKRACERLQSFSNTHLVGNHEPAEILYAELQTIFLKLIQLVIQGVIFSLDPLIQWVVDNRLVGL